MVECIGEKVFEEQRKSTDYFLDRENNCLVKKRVVRTYQCFYRKVEKSRKIYVAKTEKVQKEIGCTEEIVKKYRLQKVSLQKLEKLRNSGVPGFVFKENGNYYYAKIDHNTKFLCCKGLGTHCCATLNETCKRLFAISSEFGGCDKVKDGSTHIEKYDFISRGYESFNTNQDSFIVLQCSDCKRLRQ